MLRDLLVHVDGSEGGRRRVKLAIDLAARTGARLSGLHVTPPAEVEPRRPSQVNAAIARTAKKLAQDARAAAAIFQEETAQHSSDAQWFEATGDIVQGVCARARYADMVILGQYEWQASIERHPFPIAHSVAVHCGRPVLVVPNDAQISSFGRIAIAWDGGREAVRAVHDALPLLQLAQSIEIMTMLLPDAERDEADGTSLLAHLGNHGIKVSKEILQVRTIDEHRSLRLRVEQGHHDLLVMGGYSHPMWMEFIFGGATEATLISSKTPVLVSH